MDELDRLQEITERCPPVLFRAIPQDRCKRCLTVMDSQHLEKELYIDCDIPEIRREV